MSRESWNRLKNTGEPTGGANHRLIVRSHLPA
jgi:hypothetical protein